MTKPETADTPQFLDVLRGTALEECLNFWRDRRQANDVPLKAAIDPVEMPRHILSNLFIYQQMADGRFRCRLAGTEICRVFGHNPTGLYLDDLVVPSAAPSRQRLFSRVLERRTPVVYGGRLVHSEHSWVRFRRLLLPVSANGERPDHVFGMVIFSDFEKLGDGARPPRDSLPELEAWATPAELDFVAAPEPRRKGCSGG
jgi:hypothetical protein